ncbi:MAG: hypothetical protein LUB59_00810 [Candidatus Gastranaerophilales bacterium]|nr:hypothetical protein [Candidatus Gastranaerophilales bacterium]
MNSYDSESREFSQSISIDKTMYEEVIKIPIDDLFTEEYLNSGGKERLDNLKDKMSGKKIFVECSANRKLKYRACWELANIYVYKVVKYLIICCDVPPEKITYIGYGTASKPDKEPNRIELTLTAD